MNLRNDLNKLINNLKKKKLYAIFPYSNLTYSVFLLIRQFCIKYIYILGNWILIYFSYKKKNLIIKIFNIKNKKNIFTYKKLQKIKKKNKYGIVFTSKGIYSLEQISKLYQGGILFCLIYFSN